jgi:hypothetical protein
MQRILTAANIFVLVFVAAIVRGEDAAFRAIAFYRTTVERAHVQFAEDAVAFYGTWRQRSTSRSNPPPIGRR